MALSSRDGTSYGLIRSPEMPVHWAGFRSTTAELQRNGWEFAVDDAYGRGMERIFRIIARHDKGAFTGYAETPMRYVARSADHRYFHEGNSQEPIFLQWVRMDHQVKFIHVEKPNTLSFTRVDMEPDFSQMYGPAQREIGDVRHCGLFVPWSDKGQELIVEPASVMSMLEQLKKMQSPELAAVRERNRLREARELPREITHAKIISLEAA